MSCSLDDKPIDPKDIAKRLKSLSSAEDFFAALGVTYDEAVLRVARLHILKRMGEYLAGDDLEGPAGSGRRSARQVCAPARLLRFRIVLAAGAAGLQSAEGARSGPAGSTEDRVRRARRDRSAAPALTDRL